MSLSLFSLIREIAKRPFMRESVGISQSRYGNYPDVARILFYEKLGIRDSGTPSLINFFEEHNRWLVRKNRYFETRYFDKGIFKQISSC